MRRRAVDVKAGRRKAKEKGTDYVFEDICNDSVKL